MKTSDYVGCQSFPCTDVNQSSYIIPGVEVEVNTISIILISESAPKNWRIIITPLAQRPALPYLQRPHYWRSMTRGSKQIQFRSLFNVGYT